MLSIQSQINTTLSQMHDQKQAEGIKLDCIIINKIYLKNMSTYTSQKPNTYNNSSLKELTSIKKINNRVLETMNSNE
jgi:aspartyl-tRNA synthetase